MVDTPPLVFTNSLGGALEPFRPRDPQAVTLYVCGPTVYDLAHLGNARPAVVFDVLARLLRRRFPHLVYARNITDIDDKITAAARARGLSIGEVTRTFTAAYQDDMARLGCLPPDLEPRVTENVGAIIDLVSRLVGRGHAYVAEGHVLFHVPSFPAYGRLSGRSLEEMIAGARVEVAPYKRHPADFVLWKPSTPDLPGWESPWGRGRPGWHIECSAMIEAHLGCTIDIHGGGADLIFPHHENEIAQGTAAHDGASYAGLWLHNGMVTVDGAKMAKSAGNMVTVRSALARWPGEAIRLVLLSAHYRQPVDWSEAAAERATRTLQRLHAALAAAGSAAAGAAPDPTVIGAVEAALADDLAFPRALAALAAAARRLRATADAKARAGIAAGIRAAGSLLGLLEQPEGWTRRLPDPAAATAADDARIAELVAARAAARAQRDWALADSIRTRLAEEGIRLEDREGETLWHHDLQPAN